MMREIEYLRLSRHDIENVAGDPYMERWLMRTRSGYRRVHHILRSDDDYALHDHPFDFVSLILWGRYIEEVPLDASRPAGPRVSREYGPGSVLHRRAEDAHRLELPYGPVWTVVRTGPKRRDWGYYLPSGQWVIREEYERLMGAQKRERAP